MRRGEERRGRGADSASAGEVDCMNARSHTSGNVKGGVGNRFWR